MVSFHQKSLRHKPSYKNWYSKILQNTPSIIDNGGNLPNNMIINSVNINHVICVKVIGNGS